MREWVQDSPPPGGFQFVAPVAPSIMPTPRRSRKYDTATVAVVVGMVAVMTFVVAFSVARAVRANKLRSDDGPLLADEAH